MAYIRLFDYSRAIQDVQLQQIISSNDSIREVAEAEAEAEVISYLTAKYDVDSEFTNTTVFNTTTTYYANDLVELNFPAFDATKSGGYINGDLFVNAGLAYIVNTAFTGAFNASKCELLGRQYDLVYVKVPEMEFNYRSYYVKGDKVFYKNKVYTALLPSPLIDHQSALQYSTTKHLPYPNVWPDDPANGTLYWGVGKPYKVIATLPTDSVWQKGDNRSVQLVNKIVDIILYNLHSRISPKNIPQLRMDRYASAIAWLDMAKTGEITADIPVRQPRAGGRIRWASQPRNDNNY